MEREVGADRDLNEVCKMPLETGKEMNTEGNGLVFIHRRSETGHFKPDVHKQDARV